MLWFRKRGTVLRRIDPIAISELAPKWGRVYIHTTPFNTDFLFVPAVLDNRRCAGYNHRNNTITALPNLSEFESLKNNIFYFNFLNVVYIYISERGQTET